MPRLTFFATVNTASGTGWTNPENLYLADSSNASTYIGSGGGSRTTYLESFGIVGTGNGQVPSGSTINSIRINAYGRKTANTSTCNIYAYYDYDSTPVASGTAVSIPYITSGSQYLDSGFDTTKDGSNAWTTGDLDDASFAVRLYHYKGAGGTIQATCYWVSVTVDFDYSGVIQEDNNATYTFTSSSNSTSFTTSGSDRGLLVGILKQGSATISGVTYNSVSMTNETGASYTDTQGFDLEIWKLENPASGSNNISITLSGSDTCRVFVRSYTGVDQTDMTEASNKANNAGSNHPSVSVTTSTNDAWVWGVVASEADGSTYYSELTSDDPVYEPNTNNDEGTWISGHGEAWIATAGSLDFDFYTADSSAWVIGAVAIKPKASAFLPKIIIH